MKKLMIAAAIVCAAALSQAASVTWTTSGITFAGEGSTVADLSYSRDALTGVKGYLFYGLSAGDYALLTSAETIYNGFTANGDSSTLKVGDTTYSIGANGQYGVSADGEIFWDSQKGVTENVPDYAALVLTYNDGSKDYYSASTVATESVPVGGAEGVIGLAWGDGNIWADDPVFTTWSAAGAPIPEPTSGLLLLLGVAGLALRRRRA